MTDHRRTTRGRWSWRCVPALLVMLCTSTGCLRFAGARSADAVSPARAALHRLRFAGTDRSYLLTMPANARVRQPVPLLLVFHGYRGSGGVIRYTSDLDRVAPPRGWAVAYVNGTGRLPLVNLSWNAATCCGAAETDRVDDVGFVHAIVDTLAHQGWIDRRRVYAAGFSAGGMLALRLACERHPIVAGVADVAGAMPDTSCTARHALPVLLVRGDADDELAADHATHRRRNDHHFATSYTGAQRFWSRNNGCVAGVDSSEIVGATVLASRACPAGADVRQLIVHGIGHQWPGGRSLNRLWPHPRGPLDASTTILDFFQQHGAAGVVMTGSPDAVTSR